MLWKAFTVWIGLVALAIGNGAVREAWITPAVGAPAAQVVSSLVLAALILVAAFVTIPWIAPGSSGEAFLVGGLWLALTVAFEFLAGHYLFGSDWDELLANYAFWRGRAWVLVLAATFIAPWIAARARDLPGI